MRGDVLGNTLLAFALAVFLMLFFCVSCSKEEAEEKPVRLSRYSYSNFEMDILSLVNDYRNSTGRNTLGKVSEISLEAKNHNLHMRSAMEVCHHNFGQRFNTLKKRIGARSMGENVGYGYRTAGAIFEAWLKSPNHRKIIEGDHTHFGISALKEEGKWYVTLIVIRK